MKRQSGFTIIEMLVAGAVFAVVMGMVGMFFSSNTQLQRRTQARSELQDRVRTVMQLLTQDLQLVGAGQYISGSSVQKVSGWNRCDVTVCIDGTNDSTTNRDTVSGRYVTSLLAFADACRKFSYSFSGTTLRRSDVKCNAAGSSDQDLADNILALDIKYECSTGTGYDVASGCPRNSGQFLRSVKVTVVGQSDTVYGQDTTPYPLANGGSVNCSSNYLCFGMTQEVLLPNLKDN
jgi:prepilin-type N-terminal cleavage/methylation domain-containing protein